MRHTPSSQLKAWRREALLAAESVMHGLTCRECGLYPEAQMVLIICEWSTEEFLRAVEEFVGTAP